MIDSLSAPERQRLIHSTLMQQGRLSVPEIMELFSISEATARRDLMTLASEGKARRIHGGVILVDPAPPEMPLLRREDEQAEEKSRIGRAAAGLIANGETIFISSGTTALETAKHLRDHQNLTVITNSLPVMNALAGVKDITVIALGGQLRENELSFIGHIAEQALAELHVDKVIMGIRGISLDHGLTNDYLAETQTDRAILKIGRTVIITADYTKINRVATALLVPLKSIQVFVTDSNADEEFLRSLKKLGIAVVVA